VRTFKPDARLTVQGNGFTNCQTAVELQAAGYGIYLLPTDDAFLNLGCNTIRRDDDQRPGTTIGVHLRYVQAYIGQLYPPSPPPFLGYYYPGIRIDDFNAAPNTTYMKNWFDDANVGPGGTYNAFVNDQNNYTLNYKTFGPNGSFPPPPVNYSQHDDALSVGNRSIPVNNDAPNTTFGTETCQNQMPPFPYAGIQFRGSAGTGRTATTPANGLAQNWPNPASATTTFAYQLKSGTQKAELLIRRATDGREMERLPLDVGRSTCELSVQGWPAGTYFATLLVEGVPGATRRVVVE
jgi:hypothetical protein